MCLKISGEATEKTAIFIKLQRKDVPKAYLLLRYALGIHFLCHEKINIHHIVDFLQ